MSNKLDKMTSTVYCLKYAQGTQSDLAITVQPSSFYLGDVRAAHHVSGATTWEDAPGASMVDAHAGCTGTLFCMGAIPRCAENG
jgi:hypothetical protein